LLPSLSFGSLVVSHPDRRLALYGRVLDVAIGKCFGIYNVIADSGENQTDQAIGLMQENGPRIAVVAAVGAVHPRL
jgi:hypothetical protein